MRRPVSRVLLIAVACSLGGCSIVPQGGMAERCADFMTRADPGAHIDITGSKAAAQSLTTSVATVEGVRIDLPQETAVPRHIAVECRFENGVLIGFRWTKGPA
jgi:hypothetical protein